MADTSIASTINTSHDDSHRLEVATMGDKVVCFYVDSGNDLRMVYSNDGHATAATDVEIHTGSVAGYAIYPEWENPHIANPGDIIHVAVSDINNNELTHFTVDISDWSTSTPVIIDDTGGTVVAYRTDIGMVYTTSGDIIIVHTWDTSSTSTTEAWRSTNGGASWSAITSPVGGTSDGNRRRLWLGFPADASAAAADAGFLMFNSAPADLLAYGYDQSADTWASITVRGYSTPNVFGEVQRYNACIASTGKVYTASQSNLNSGTADVDITEVVFTNTPSKTNLTDAMSNMGENRACAITCDWTNSDRLYVWSANGALAGERDIDQVVSDDLGSTWGSISAISEDTADDLRLIGAPRIISDRSGDGGWIQPVWTNDDLLELFINKTNDIEIDVAGGGGGGGGTSRAFNSSAFESLALEAGGIT